MTGLRLVLGVVGHVDHGKTSLVRALTGVDTDRLAEEKRRGVSIVLGFAHAHIGGVVDFVDAPGHERFVRAMVGGVTGADAVLMVVDAREGVRPQTVEHATIAALLGVREAVIAVTKADLAGAAQIAAATREAIALAAGLGLRAPTPIPVSAATGQGLDVLLAAIADLARGRAPTPDDGFAYLPIDRAFVIAGQGVVVTGTLRRGRLTADTPLDLLPQGRPIRVRGLQAHGAPVDVAQPGQRVAVNLRGASVGDLPRGAVLAGAGSLVASEWLTVALCAAPGAPPLYNGAKVDLLIGAGQTAATVRLLDRETLEPGASSIAQLRAARPLAVPAGDGFILRAASPPATLAGGKVVDPQTGRLRRFEPVRLERLAALAVADGPARLALVLADAGARGVPLDRLARLAGLAPSRAAAQSPGVRLKGDILVDPMALRRVHARVIASLGETPEPIPRETLAQSLPRVGPGVLDAVLAALAAAGRVRLEAGSVALVRAAQDKARAVAEDALARDLADRLDRGALSPPDLIAEATTPGLRRAIARLVRDGLAVRAPDRVQKREILFHRDAVADARRRLDPLLAAPLGLSVGEIGRALGISRKFSVPLLEHLDAIGFTRRVGDRRVLSGAATRAEHPRRLARAPGIS